MAVPESITLLWQFLHQRRNLQLLVSMLSAVTRPSAVHARLQHALCKLLSFRMAEAWCNNIPTMRFVCIQVCMSTDNLFQRCRQRSKVAHGNVTNPLLQLEAIGNFVSDLGAIKELAQKNNVKSSMQSMPRLDKLSVAGDK